MEFKLALICFILFVAFLAWLIWHWTRPPKPKRCDHLYFPHAYQGKLYSRCSLCGEEHPDSGKFPASGGPATPFAMGGDD